MSQPIYFSNLSNMVTRSKKRKLNEMAGAAPVGRQALTKRKYVPEFELQRFLEREIHHGHFKVKKVKRVKDQEIPFRKSKSRRYHGLMVRKEMTQEMQALVIFLRFGSLNSDDFEWLSPSEVFKRTGVKLCTQHKLIGRWRKRNFLIMKTLREGRKGVLTPEQVQWVTSIDTLQSMVHLSLKKRAMIVRDKFQLETFDAMTLRRYYIKWKVKFIRPNYTYWKSFAEKNSLKEKQLKFVQELGSIIHEKSYDEIFRKDYVPPPIRKRLQDIETIVLPNELFEGLPKSTSKKKARRLKIMSEAFAAEKASRLKDMRKTIEDEIIEQEVRRDKYQQLKRPKMMEIPNKIHEEEEKKDPSLMMGQKTNT